MKGVYHCDHQIEYILLMSDLTFSYFRLRFMNVKCDVNWTRLQIISNQVFEVTIDLKQIGPPRTHFYLRQMNL